MQCIPTGPTHKRVPLFVMKKTEGKSDKAPGIDNGLEFALASIDKATAVIELDGLTPDNLTEKSAARRSSANIPLASRRGELDGLPRRMPAST